MYLVAFAKVGSPASICCHQPVSIGLEFVGKSSGAKGKRSGFLFPARIQGFENSAGHGASMYTRRRKGVCWRRPPQFCFEQLVLWRARMEKAPVWFPRGADDLTPANVNVKANVNVNNVNAENQSSQSNAGTRTGTGTGSTGEWNSPKCGFQPVFQDRVLRDPPPFSLPRPPSRFWCCVLSGRRPALSRLIASSTSKAHLADLTRLGATPAAARCSDPAGAVVAGSRSGRQACPVPLGWMGGWYLLRR